MLKVNGLIHSSRDRLNLFSSLTASTLVTCIQCIGSSRELLVESRVNLCCSMFYKVAHAMFSVDIHVHAMFSVVYLITTAVRLIHV